MDKLLSIDSIEEAPMKYSRFEELPVWKAAIELAVEAPDERLSQED